MNVTQRVYFYAYNEDFYNNVSGNFFNFRDGMIRSYVANATHVNSSVVNSSLARNVTTTYNGVGSFQIEPKDNNIYFLEIPIKTNILNFFYMPFNDDNNGMEGIHYVPGAIRIPIVVDGIQTRQRRYRQMIAEKINPPDNSPKLEAKYLKKFRYSYFDYETGL